MPVIVRETGVQRPTTGKVVGHQRLGNLLGASEGPFVLVREKLLSKTRLSEVKQACPGIEYNQIRFVLACLIRDLELTCEMQLLQ